MPFQFVHTARWNIERRREILKMAMLLEPIFGALIKIGVIFVYNVGKRIPIWNRCGFKNPSLPRAIFVHRVAVYSCVSI